jgi:hypothetical protein
VRPGENPVGPDASNHSHYGLEELQLKCEQDVTSMKVRFMVIARSIAHTGR